MLHFFQTKKKSYLVSILIFNQILKYLLVRLLHIGQILNLNNALFCFSGAKEIPAVSSRDSRQAYKKVPHSEISTEQGPSGKIYYVLMCFSTHHTFSWLQRAISTTFYLLAEVLVF